MKHEPKKKAKQRVGSPHRVATGSLHPSRAHSVHHIQRSKMLSMLDSAMLNAMSPAKLVRRAVLCSSTSICSAVEKIVR